MDRSQIEQASSLLRRRDNLQKRINELDPFARSGLLQLSTSRPSLPTDGALHRISGAMFEAGTEVAISGDALQIVTDLIGSLLSRQVDDIDRQLADLNVTETMQADRARPDHPAGEIKHNVKPVGDLGVGDEVVTAAVAPESPQPGATSAEDAKRAAGGPELSGIEIMVFGIAPCDCPTCRGSRR